MILVLGGNKESLEICHFLNEHSYVFIMTMAIKTEESVAFQYAQHIVQSPINEDEWMHFFEKQGISLVIDAAYPFTTAISKSASELCKKMHIPYVQFERETEQAKQVHLVHTIQTACELAASLGNRIYLTTGSKNLQEYMGKLHGKHIIANILPVSDIVHYCETIGLFAEQIIAMKGPISKGLHKELFKWANADVVITNGTDKEEEITDEIEACNELGIPCIIIAAPYVQYPEKVTTIKELEAYLNGIA